MPELRIDQLPNTVTELDATDFLIVRDESGELTGKISYIDSLPRLGIAPVLVTPNINIASDFVWVWSGQDNRLRRVSVEDLVFGNFQNRTEAANFTLTEARSIRAIEIQDSVATVTLDGNQANIGGADFLLNNFRATDVTLNASNITMYVDGVATASTSIRARRAASITVNNAATEAIFSGG